jgi:large subunit ribosomal protein L21
MIVPQRDALSKAGPDPNNTADARGHTTREMKDKSMFAVMKTGGKQYKVQAGDKLRVEKLAAEAGETVQFNEILMLGGDKATVGAPLVEGAAVQATVVDQVKGEKLIHFVKRRRKHSSKRKKGHRQQLTLIEITEVLAKGGDKTGVKAAIGAGSIAGVAVAAAAAAKPAKKAKKADAPKAEAPKAEKPKAAPKKAKAKAAPAVAEDAGEGTRPANLLTEARGGQPDDLKKISGVGPKLEGVLHSIGVFHFDQIKDWGPTEIAYMDDKLSFKGRIERDNWIEQATAFAAEQE